jgi:hypothetical protein
VLSVGGEQCVMKRFTGGEVRDEALYGGAVRDEALHGGAVRDEALHREIFA